MITMQKEINMRELKENFVKNDYFDFEFIHTEIADVFMSKKDLNLLLLKIKIMMLRD